MQPQFSQSDRPIEGSRQQHFYLYRPQNNSSPHFLFVKKNSMLVQNNLAVQIISLLWDRSSSISKTEKSYQNISNWYLLSKIFPLNQINILMVEPRLLKAVWWTDCIEQFRRKIFNDILVDEPRISFIIIYLLKVYHLRVEKSLFL